MEYVLTGFPCGFPGEEQIKSGKFSEESQPVETPRKTEKPLENDEGDDTTESEAAGYSISATQTKKKPFSFPW